MSRISTQLVPPGGWRFSQDGVIFQEQDFQSLVNTVVAHRKSNGKPDGNPRQEIQDQICENHPDTCLDTMKLPPPTTVGQNVRSFATTVKNYLLSGGVLVDQNTANIRSECCAGCHNNVPSAEARRAPGGCSKCAKMVQTGIDVIRNIALAGRKTSGDEKLMACRLCGCDLRIKVWVPVKYFDPECKELNKWPSFCWCKKC